MTFANLFITHNWGEIDLSSSFILLPLDRLHVQSDPLMHGFALPYEMGSYRAPEKFIIDVTYV